MQIVRYFMGGVVAILSGGILLLVMNLVSSVSASAQSDWASSEVRLVQRSEVVGLPPGATSCYGSIQRIHIRSTGDTDACILGESGETRLARYWGSGGFAYALARFDDAVYTRIAHFCEKMAGCAYSASADTLLMKVLTSGSRSGHAVIRDFSRYLTLHQLPEPYYTFDYEGEEEVIQLSSGLLRTGSVAVSNNGKWAVLELIDYGFVRIDMATGHYRRVTAPGGVYGQGANPTFELAISNDGKRIAIVGWNASITVYEVDGACGDILSDSTQAHFSPGVIPCRESNIDRYALFPGFKVASFPRFSDDGMYLSLYVATGTKTERAVLSPLSDMAGHLPQLYVSLGDSFVSGEGETDDRFYLSATNTVSNKCHVSTRSYPYLLRSVTAENVRNDACSGARMVEVAKQSTRLNSEVSRYAVSHISVGVGGNDAGVMGKLKTCLGVNTCEWALPERRAQTAEEVRALYPGMVTLLRQIQQTHPNATLFAVGYPKIINDNSSAQCRLPVRLLLNKTERQFINETTKYLNDVLELAAQYVGIPFMNVSGAYAGQRLCDESEGAMNGIRTGDDIAPIASLDFLKVIGAESFHPTPAGHSLVAERIRNTIATEGFGVACESCVYAATDTTPPDYWYEYGSSVALPRLIIGSFLEREAVQQGQDIPFSFPPGSFEAGSTVRLELHSESQLLAILSANDKGALSGVLKIPNDLAGYHSVHVLGTSISGESIDRYQIISIDTKKPVAAKEASQSLRSSVHKAMSTDGGIATIASQLNPSSNLEATAHMSDAKTATAAASVKGATSFAATASRSAVLGIQGIDARLWWVALGVGMLLISILAYMIGRRQV